MDDAAGMIPEEAVYEIRGRRIMTGAGGLTGGIMGDRYVTMRGDIAADLLRRLGADGPVYQVSLAQGVSVHLIVLSLRKQEAVILTTLS
jgi:hypothetical protein